MVQRRMACWLGMASAALLVGCATARHVEMRPDGGVVAIPANSNTWPYYHRDKALALIEQDAPNGYEIVHEEEAVARKVTHVTTHRKAQPAPALVLKGEASSEGYPAGYPTQAATVAFPLGQAREKSTEVAHEHDVKEWRIYYRLNK